jgi:hypothetical protein
VVSLHPIFDIEAKEESVVYQLTKRASLTFLFDGEGGLRAGRSLLGELATATNFVRVPPKQVPEAFCQNLLVPKRRSLKA